MSDEIKRRCLFSMPDSFYDDFLDFSSSAMACDEYKISCMVDSPIEGIFASAFNYVTSILGIHFSFKKTDQEKVNLIPQYSIGDYRVDFLLVDNASKHKGIVIECDGHDFHEKTKKQAARDKKRDRYLQSKGYVVLHFTGSEIYKNSIDCVLEAVDALRQLKRNECGEVPL